MAAKRKWIRLFKFNRMIMKTILRTIVLIALSVAIVSCTQQSMTRNFGGKMNVKLPKGQKLIMATWKNTSLFYLTEPMDSGYIPKSKKFTESSSFGVMESEITFIESR